jgi:hypothetical protein
MSHQFSSIKKEFNMLRKFFPASIVLCMIAFFTTGWKSFSPHKPGPVSIKIVGFPEGTVTATGALEFTGTNYMVVRSSGKSRAGAIHCTNSVVTPEGTFTILMDCQFTTSTGQWRITNGTGAYTNLKGNGSLVMYFNEEGQDVEDLHGKIF